MSINMKARFLPLLSSIGLLLFSSCQKQLDVIAPSGSELSLEQVRKGAKVSSDRADATLVGMYSQLTAREGVFRIQGDFGYPSFACRLEHAGDNVVSTTAGYNWFNGELRLSDFQNNRSTVSEWAWTATYTNIKIANDVISVNASAETPSAKIALGQAKAMRAWDYFLLAQLYAKTYVGHESDACVPIVDETTSPEQLSNNPRKTVKEVYTFILKDLDEAVTLLEGFEPEVKNKISGAVAYGIRCRVRMVMNDWAGAAEDARSAIKSFKKSPYSLADVSIPNFDDVQQGSGSMWGIIIGSEDYVTKSGIANYTSMFTSLCFGAGAYTTSVGTYKMINSRLWMRIPKSDIRRDWWVHNQVVLGKTKEGKDRIGYTSSLLHNAYPRLEGPLAAELLPLTVVKFAPTNKDPLFKENSVDFQLMRVEEMYYNLAEAMIMSGDIAGGKSLLIDFVQKYRDPEYNPTATSAKELQDEIYFQRRVEFWGEGISWFDMLRLNKGIDRVDVATKDTGGYPETCRFNVPAGDPTFTFQIPMSEEQNNKAIEGNNNPAYTPPTDMI